MKQMKKEPSVPGVKKSSWKIWAVSFSFGAAVTALVAAYRSGFSYSKEAGRLYGCLSDGAFVAGVLLLGLGLLLWVSTTGFFDMIAYGFLGMRRHFFPLPRFQQKKTYYEYHRSREENRRPVPAALLGSGLFFLLLAGAAMLLYGF